MTVKPATYPPRPDLTNPYRSTAKMHTAFEFYKRGGERRALIRKFVVALHVTEATAATWVQIFRRLG